ncbi:MAG: hypothetical protein ACI4V7_09080 [Succinivibrionaceae bacterium]
MRKKILSLLSYVLSVFVGFGLFYFFRTELLPSLNLYLSDEKGFIKKELVQVKNALPIENGDKSLVLKDVTFDDELNVLFYVEINNELDSIKSLEVKFNELHFYKTMCESVLSQEILKKNGTISVQLSAPKSNLSTKIDLNCTQKSKK